jgi:hypothetical protein
VSARHLLRGLSGDPEVGPDEAPRVVERVAVQSTGGVAHRVGDVVACLPQRDERERVTLGRAADEGLGHAGEHRGDVLCLVLLASAAHDALLSRFRW